MKKIILLLLVIILLSGFSFAMPNPAAKYCKEQGNSYEIREDNKGNEYGVCKSKDFEKKARDLVKQIKFSKEMKGLFEEAISV